MKHKKIVIILLLLVLLCTIVILYYSKQEKNILFKTVVYQAGWSANTYYFTVYDDRTLEITKREKGNVSFGASDFLSNPTTICNVKLTQNELDEVLIILEKIKNNSHLLNKQVVKDGRDVVLYYDNMIFEFNDLDILCPIGVELMDKLVELSSVLIN